MMIVAPVLLSVAFAAAAFGSPVMVAVCLVLFVISMAID